MSQSIEELLRSSRAIISLQGREYVTFRGLLYVAHQAGLESIDVELVSWDPEGRAAVVKAMVRGSRGSFADYGDADPSNVNRMVASACLRMASPRAKGRALRSYLGIGSASGEELPGDGPLSAEPETRPATTFEGPPVFNFDAAARWGVRVGSHDTVEEALEECQRLGKVEGLSPADLRVRWRKRCAELRRARA